MYMQIFSAIGLYAWGVETDNTVTHTKDNVSHFRSAWPHPTTETDHAMPVKGEGICNI